MSEYTVTFLPHNKTVKVKGMTSLLEAASLADIALNNLCGGDGICGRCKMMIKKGKVSGKVSGKLTREDVQSGLVLACLAMIISDITVLIPDETSAKEKIIDNEDADRFKYLNDNLLNSKKSVPCPLVKKIYLELEKPELDNNSADHQRLCSALQKKIKTAGLHMRLSTIRALPKILRENKFHVTATVGLKREIIEIMDVEGGNTEGKNYCIVIDIGTTTIVAHLVDSNNAKTISAKACFNSQGVYGREVTGRIISAERVGVDKLQKIAVLDINNLIKSLVHENGVRINDITAVVCAGNTIMMHFLLGLPVENIRRTPYIAASVSFPPFRASEIGIQINPCGLLYCMPGVSGWVGGDITAGILATGIHEKDELSLLLDIGTNGEIVAGNKEWLVASSASAGPALEGAGVECGIRAEKGAIEKVYIQNYEIHFKTIGDLPPNGICGSGIIDLVSVLLDKKLINRSGKFTDINNKSIAESDGIKRFILAGKNESASGNEIYINEIDIENIITAKAAIFAAMKIMLHRLDLCFDDIDNFYIAGAFGNYINIHSAINIGLIPDIPLDKIKFAGNTSIDGAKIVALYENSYYDIEKIRENTIYYDLMAANDYIEEFKKALFLPHTDIEIFQEEK